MAQEGKYNVNTAIIGMNKDSVPSRLQEGQILYALNAVSENYDGNSVTYQNDAANVECVAFPNGYKVIGVKNITEINRVLFWLHNPISGDSEIGYIDGDSCDYVTLITDFGQDCKLGFSLSNPIHKAVVKTTNCSTQVYWTDGLNPRRYIDFDDLPWKEIKDLNNDYKKIKDVGKLDCNKLNVQPDFSVPYIEPVEVTIGGSLTTGVYQFAVQYSNANGDGYTSYYNVSNPISVFQDIISPDFNLKTSKAITINVLDIDITGLYEYFNISVIETVNNITTVKLVGTFPTSAATLNSEQRTQFRYTYTGAEVSPIQLDITDIFLRFPYYDIAQDLTEVDNVLVWDQLSADETINYQPIWNNVKLYWETHKVPYNEFEGYTNGINSAILRGYMRDEVYAFEGCFVLKNGKETKSFHIPGRPPTSTDREIISTSNRDNISYRENSKCEDPIDRERWQVYNTGSVIDKTQEYKDFLANNPPIVITNPNPGQTIIGNIHIGCNNGGAGTSQGCAELTITFNSPTPTGGIILQIGMISQSGGVPTAMGWDIGYTPTVATNGFYGSDPFTINIPGGVTTFSVPKCTIGNNRNTWVCLPTRNDIYALYFKVKCNTAKFTVTSFQSNPIAVHNLTDICSSTTTTISKEDCYKGPYEYGEFAYWESEEPYPNNSSIWGELHNKKIRHHKFPDYIISPIHTQNTEDGEEYKGFEYSIFPIGVRVDVESLYQALQASSLSQEDKDQIVGFKIFRGNRATNKSVIAKGIFHNVGKSEYNNKTYYYPNYPYNDVSPDNYYLDRSFFRANVNSNPANTALETNSLPGVEFPLGYSPSLSNYRLNGFQDNPERFTFHSPDTHFYQPSLSADGSYLKLDAVIYGKSYGHFVKVEDNAEYKFLTRDSLIASVGVALTSGFTVGAGTFGSPTFTIASAGPVYTAMNDIFEKITPYINFGYTHNSFGIYGNYETIPNEFSSEGSVGFKNRSLNYLQYVNDGANGIEDGNTLNNLRRESAVYMHANDSLLFTHSYNSNIPQDNSRYTLASIGDNLSPETVRERDISSYYGAIKRNLPRQWGRLYSYETIDTGYYHPLYKEDESKYTRLPAVFGGDIYINRFAYKSKLSVFRRTTVGAPNGADIDYSEIGNVNYPVFWISTKPLSFDVDYDTEVQRVLNQIEGTNGTVIANILSGGGVAVARANSLIIAILKDVYNRLGIKNINLDRWDLEGGQSSGLDERGLIYLFVYGIPYYFCESEVNVDYRQAYDELAGNFFPRVSNDIPDDWLQETNVPIINDNTYTYNQTYSKQNKETFIDHLKEDFDPTKACFTEFPNRAIWSDKSSQEEVKNNWLIYRPSAYYDFPKSAGRLLSLDKIQNIEVLARFENKSQKYNALTTVQVSDGPQGYLGNPALFSGTPPIDLAETDTGYAGSQNKFLLRTEFGQVFVDAKRGNVFLLNGGVKAISSIGMSKWFALNLPFNILKANKDFPVDNNFNGIGISGVYDQYFQRIFITKIDYEAKEGVEVFESGQAYYNDQVQQISREVQLGDPEYFINKSWTVSYSFKTNSWISFHSFIPNYYVGDTLQFQSGINKETIFRESESIIAYPGSSLWSHNKINTSLQTYYNISYPYILEVPFVYQGNDQILQSVKTYCNSRVYTNFDTFYEPNEILFFNKAIVYNNQQCSGIRNLVPRPQDNPYQYLQYPIHNTESIDILVSKSDNLFIFNDLWDVQIDKSSPIFLTSESFITEDKTLNQDNMNYTYDPYNQAPLRAKESFVRFIHDARTDVRLISRFYLTQSTPSYV